MRIRTIVLALGCTAAACLLCAQAISMVLSKREPHLAHAVFPWNGEAAERMAFFAFRDAVEDEKLSVDEAAKRARSLALRAIREHPLSPDAHAILARAAPDTQKKNEIIALASRMNRRDLNLQTLALERAVGLQDLPAATEVFDQILRAHPSYTEQLFPPLLDVIDQPGAENVFAEFLDNSAPWHGQFLMYAVRNGDKNIALARLRALLNEVPDGFDAILIAGLVREGELEEGFALYNKVIGSEAAADGPLLTWDSRFPPLDWKLVSEAGFRALPSRDQASLTIDVEPGKGGVIASRLVELTDQPQTLLLSVSGGRGDLSRNLRAELKCGERTEAFAQTTLQTGETRLELPPRSAAPCAIIYLAVNARAFRGERDLDLELAAPQLVSR